MCKAININFIGHYGNVPQVEMVIENQCVVFNAKGEGQLTNRLHFARHSGVALNLSGRRRYQVVRHT